MFGTVLPCGLKEEGSIFLSPQCWEAETHVLWLTGNHLQPVVEPSSGHCL